MNRTGEFVKNDLKKFAVVVLVIGFMCGGFKAIADDWDYDDDDWGYDDDDWDYGGDNYGDIGDVGDADIGDTVIIDDSVNVYDDGYYGGRGRRRDGRGGGDAAGAAIMGFMGGMVVNEMMQDKGRPAPQATPGPSYASPPPATARANPTLEQRLEEIEDLRKRGILTESEYNAKRKAVIDGY